jgi:integrase
MTMSQWAARWLEGYEVNRASTVRQARTHLRHIEAEFGNRRLNTIQPSDVRNWIVKLRNAGLADSYVYALHRRLSQLFADAIHDGITARNPCSRRTSPKSAIQRAYVLDSSHVWALHDAMPQRLRAAVMLGAFVGLRSSEVCGLRTRDVDFMRGVVSPRVQFGGGPLKSAASVGDVPIPSTLSAVLAAHAGRWSDRDGEFMVNEWGKPLSPRTLERAFRAAVASVRADDPTLPEAVRFHDLRHHFASLLIASGANVKVVQARLRHASAKTTLDVYSHLFPDTDESTRRAVEQALCARAVARDEQSG